MIEAESKTYKGHNISVCYDECAESPREWDNLCVIHVAHRNYGFGDENYSDNESIQEARREAKANGDIILPLYMYDHSGITISTSPFSCRWDSGQVGFVQIPKEKVLEEFSAKIFHKKLKEKVIELAQGEVETLDKYLRGEVYGFIVDKNGDSCWGYYSIEDAMQEAEYSIDCTIEYNKKEHFKKLKCWIKNKVPYYVREEFSQAISV